MHPDLLHCISCKFMFPWHLNPFPNHSDRFFKGHKLRNICLRMTTSQNTAYTHQINKIDLDRLYLYNLFTWSPSIQEIPKYNLITDKNAFKFHRISHSSSIHPQKQSNAHTKYIGHKRTILTCINDLSCLLTAFKKTKVTYNYSTL